MLKLGCEHLLQKTEIKVAFYKEKSKQENPEYEIYLEIDDLGVVHSYKVDYGNFEIKALLKKFELLPKTTCKM